MIISDKFLYVDYPKAASTFMWKVMKNIIVECDNSIKTHPTSGLEMPRGIKDNYENRKIIANIREPISWYGSLYNHLKEGKFQYFNLEGDVNDFIEDMYYNMTGFVTKEHWHSLIDFSLVKEQQIGVMTLLYINYYYPNKRLVIQKKLKEGEDILRVLDEYEYDNIINYLCKKETMRIDLINTFKELYDVDFTEQIMSFEGQNVRQKNDEMINEIGDVVKEEIKKREIFLYEKYY